MAIIKQVSLYDFEEEFRSFDRMNNFSYEGLQALYDLLDEPEEIFELDVISLCCDYNEDSATDIIQNCSINVHGETDPDMISYIVEQYLSDRTFSVLLENGNFLYQAF